MAKAQHRDGCPTCGKKLQRRLVKHRGRYIAYDVCIPSCGYMTRPPKGGIRSWVNGKWVYRREARG